MIDKETVKRLGQLSRMQIEDSELEAYAQSLSAVLKWFDMLDEVDVSSDKDTVLSGRSTLQREDIVTSGGHAEAIVSNAVDSKFNMFSVPKVVE
jgi:aspartyl-tRNA(Asn)/glutamyl-tRNA(Gln) amidotransferase subunit C